MATPWMALLEAIVMIESATKAFGKFNSGLILAFNMLQGRKERNVQITDVVELLGGNKEVVLAIVIQNQMHCKNTLRTEAISDGSYKVIND